tara:strand:+ start:54 stop:641 length:588 start_codon:yes stop_codon:yes gene_type:complete
MNLHCAVYDGDLSAVQSNLVHFKGNDKIKSLALVLAVAMGRTEVVRTFLKTEVDINMTDHFFNFQRKWETRPIKMLQRKWQRRLMPFSRGWSPRMTPLCAAAFFGHAKIVQMLVDAGADINLDPYSDEGEHENRPAWNALTCALMGGNELIARYLMFMGARATDFKEVVDPMTVVLLKKKTRLPLEMIGHTLSYI